MKKFWLVWNGRTERPLDIPRFEHLDRYSADKEAQRLARLHPRCKFFVLEALRYWEKNDLRVVDLGDPVDDEAIPF